jgi:hypothetical protein
MFVSTFEILVKPQLPNNLPGGLPASLSNLRRTVVQGYFLNIANVSNAPVSLSLSFTAVSPIINIEQTLTFLDVTGGNIPGSLTPDPTIPGGARARFDFPNIAASDTVQFILQPDIVQNNGELLTSPTGLEFRGYVEIFLAANSPARAATLLITPEQRATFFRTLDTAPQLDQIVYNLPTAHGGSLFTLTR